MLFLGGKYIVHLKPGSNHNCIIDADGISIMNKCVRMYNWIIQLGWAVFDH